jgi:hypothetical protein
MTFDYEHLNPNKFSDSAGTPWSGRAFDVNNYSGDDGSAPAQLIAALRAFREGAANAELVVDAIRESRLLIPLLAELTESEVGPNGQKVDKSADLSIVTVATPDEQNGLPVFSSVAAMQRWNPQARPVPADARRVALAAVVEENTRIILDPESETEFAIRRPAIAAIAQDLSWVHPSRNQAVRDAIAKVTNSVEEFLSFDLTDGDQLSRLHSAELQLELHLKPGLSEEQLAELMERLAIGLGESAEIAEHVDSMRVKLA